MLRPARVFPRRISPVRARISSCCVVPHRSRCTQWTLARLLRRTRESHPRRKVLALKYLVKGSRGMRFACDNSESLIRMSQRVNDRSASELQTLKRTGGPNMLIKKDVRVACAVALFAGMSVATAFAQTPDKRTLFTFSGPVTMPGVTLPAGQYMFRLADPSTSAKVVQVLSAD